MCIRLWIARILRALSLCLLCLSVPEGARGQVIMEFVPAPRDGMPEWVELLNDRADSVDLRGWVLHDASSARPVISTVPLPLPPGARIVLSRDTGLVRWFPGLSCVHRMPGLPAINNSGDDLVLKRPDGTVADSVPWRPTWGGADGASLERRDPALRGAMSDAWSVSMHPAGMTPCARNSVEAADDDVRVVPLTVLTPVPQIGAPFQILARAVNEGRFASEQVEIVLAEDVDRNGDVDAGEELGRVLVGRLEAGDSLRAAADVPPDDNAVRVFVTETRALRDERPWNNRRVDTVRCALPEGRVLVNEIMYAPTPGEPEWIELVNTSGSPVDMEGWSVADNSGSRALPRFVIDAGGFVVLAASAAIRDVHPDIPSPVVIAALPSLNNSGDAVILRQPGGSTADSVQFIPEWGGSGGRSLERVYPVAPGHLQEMWTESAAPRGTPGRRNDGAARERDLALRGAWHDGGQLVVRVRNVGLLERECAALFIRDEVDETTPPVVASVPALASRTEADVRVVLPAPRPGSTRWRAHLACQDDERPSNDTVRVRVVQPVPAGTIVVNEIMYEPGDGFAEWIEIVTESAVGVGIEGLRIADAPTPGGSRAMQRIDAPLLLTADAPMVLAADSGVFLRFPALRDTPRRVHVFGAPLSLGNDGDAVVVLDEDGGVVDSVRYDPRWHHPDVVERTNRSLERIHPTLPSNAPGSWSSSAAPAGATPAFRNAMYADPGAPPAGTGLTFTPNPFSPDGDGHEDVCMIGYHVGAEAATLRARVFDRSGRLVRTLASPMLTGANGVLVFDGRDDRQQRLGIGLYVVLIEALDRSGTTAAAIKGVVVVATRL